MKKLLLITLLALVVLLPASYSKNQAFLTTGVDVDASTTKVNVTDFTSIEVSVGDARLVAITVIFTRAAGSSSTVDFVFEASYDGGVTWATFEGVKISVATNHSVVSGTTVRVLTLVSVPGIAYLRLKSITNNDSGNNLTACNVILSC